MKLFLTGNSTLQPLARALAPYEVAVSDFNDYRAVLAGLRDSALTDQNAVLFLIDGMELAAENGFDTAATARAASEYSDACGLFAAAHPSLIVIASTFRLPSFSPRSFGEVIDPLGMAAIEGEVLNKIATASRQNDNLYVFDLGRLIGHFGERAAYNSGMRFFARFGFSAKFSQALTDHLKSLLSAILLRSKKVLALDFDNTLWGGVVGEVGAHGIELSQEGRGRAYRQFQFLVHQLSQRGIILVGLSKNNEGDADEVFEKNDMMVLKREHFSQRFVNWKEKPRNLESAMESLNLGLDSVVFIDDNPVERKLMRDMLPDVQVPEFPESPELLPDWFRETIIPQYFPAYRLTVEDLQKTQQYRANADRSVLKEKLSLTEFVGSLEIDLKFLVNKADHAVRFSQMTQKTNQFNLTTRRYSVIEITSMIASDRYDVLGMEYSDRFGREGIVGLAILDGDTGELDTFLMSCRVIGRGVEDELMRMIERLAAGRGHSELRAVFLPTKKNIVSKDFLSSQGFAGVEDDKEDGQRYRKVIHVETEDHRACNARTEAATWPSHQ
jgi:FkbH-like protein